MKKIILSGFGLLLLSAGLYSFKADSGDRYFQIARNLDIFASVFKNVNAYYVDDVNPSMLMNEGIYTMLANLDPYTNYIPEDRIEDYRSMTTGQYGGIGATIVTRNNKTIVIMPYKGYAAEKSGLSVGDQIIEVDDINVVGKAPEEVSRILKGQAGTELRLKVKRLGTDELLPFSIMREQIQLKNVTYVGMITEDIGMLHLTDFTQNASKEVKEAIETLKKQGATKIVLDLRGNPGGLLTEAVNISNLFVSKGNEIVSTKGKVKEWNKVYKALNNEFDLETPLVVLTNRMSASASEIVSGVIQDYDRGVLIGENTYGKGLVQTTLDLSYNSKLKVTVAKYYIPSGRCIQAIDYSNRNEDGSVGKIPDSLKVPFLTQNGRKVYSGGGVRPDVEIEYKELSPVSYALLEKGYLFDFATFYKYKHPELSINSKEFSLSDAEYEEFVKFLKDRSDYSYETDTEIIVDRLEKASKYEESEKELSNELTALKNKLKELKSKDLQKHKEELRELIEEEIISHYLFEPGKVEASFDDDPVIREAISVLNDPVRYKKILSEIK